MGMVFCRGCGKEIHETAPTCPHCGAQQNLPTTQNGKNDVVFTSYSQVPWYRKNLFTVLCIFFFPPGLLLPLLTGDVYYVRKGQLKTYSTASKIFIISWSILIIFIIADSPKDSIN
jgi:hypothetical protein